MKNLVIMPNTQKQEALDYTVKLCKFLSDLNVQPILDNSVKHFFSTRDSYMFMDVKNNFSKIDFFVSVGGDGTLMHCAKWAVKAKKPIVGVNLGTLGFLTHLEADQMDVFEELIKGNFTVQSRMLLEVELHSKKSKQSFFAINDAVVCKGKVSKIIDIGVTDKDQMNLTYRCDGLIFSTPTGSTAYSLSAGGPVIDPRIDSIIMTPICTHMGYNKTIVFHPEKEIHIKANENNATEIFLTVDGEDFVQINDGDYVSVKQSDKRLLLIELESTNFYEILNEKLIKKETES